MNVISRSEAKSKNIVKFFTGNPCQHGHLSERYVASGWCCECTRLFNAKQRLKHSGKSHPTAIKWRELNRDYDLQRKKNWCLENKEKILERERYRRKNDVSYMAKKQCQNMMHRTLRMTEKSKTTKTEDHLGYTKAHLVSHIESLFLDSMSWDNFGRGPGFWNIDHIKPISAFVSEGETRPHVINALSNLQPLWFEDNAKKSDKYEAA